MTHRVELEPAYVLHRRPYSNTSLILECLTEKYGRMAVLARSARGLKSRYRGKLELFSPMLISWSGKGELKTLGSVEFGNVHLTLNGNALICGFYLNEILMRLLQREDPYVRLFHLYAQALQQLNNHHPPQIVLRLFEKHLLQELGFGLSYHCEHESKKPIEKEGFYHLLPNQGFVRSHKTEQRPEVFCGRTLLAFHEEALADQSLWQEARRLMRLALSFHLGDRPLKSRDLLYKSQ